MVPLADRTGRRPGLVRSLAVKHQVSFKLRLERRVGAKTNLCSGLRTRTEVVFLVTYLLAGFEY